MIFFVFDKNLSNENLRLHQGRAQGGGYTPP